ncbi:hypothetical protein IMZ16_09660 [Cruoricaptor ignavus]|uniref:Uncharacterized protein n=1 Tax=Cruoricaptor ignavus TaxID=1118202 RepID=A0A7M1T1W7_9FLAO|nr:hypothetical protein [Cruoricaptor ignavus]QOR73761.1 hypothetical protein IMZ16_09660 [Cruoricaptor ignavus]
MQAAAHGVAQGTLSLMQGASFKQAFIAGALGSLGASAWGYALNKVGLSQFASSAVGTVAFGALSGGIGAELSGGNFWQGAVIGGIVAGLNHAMHLGDSPNDNGYDENGKKVSNKGGDRTDYLYDKNGNEIASTSVKVTFSQGGEVSSSFEGYGFRYYTQGTGGALYDPSFDIMSSFVGGVVTGKALGFGVGYLNKVTGGLKQWVRTGSSYSIKGGFKTYSTRWGAGGNHWKKIGNSTLQNWNRSFRQTKLPGNSWRVQDPGHFHWWKK